jgi:PST family polysaccharide transporter
LYAIQLLRLGLPLAMLSILMKFFTGVHCGNSVKKVVCGAWLSIFVKYFFNLSPTRSEDASAEPSSERGVILQTMASRCLLAIFTLRIMAWVMPAIFISIVLSFYFLVIDHWEHLVD